MQGSPSGKLEVAFVVISSTQKVVANMQVDREYNACKALDPQIDNEDDVHHSSPDYEINEQELQTQMWLGGLHGCNEWAGRTGADGADWGTGGRSGLRNRGRGGLGQTGQTGADRADWGGRGGLERTCGWGGGGRIGSSLEGRKGWTRKPGAGVPAEWADKLGRARPGRLPSSRLRAEGIPRVLSPDVDCRIIWLHTLRIHIRFFGAHIVVLFLGTHTSKAQRASTSDKFFGSLGALNITYSMLIQMEHAIRDIVIVTHKGGSSSLVPPSPLCTSCCS